MRKDELVKQPVVGSAPDSSLIDSLDISGNGHDLGMTMWDGEISGRTGKGASARAESRDSTLVTVFFSS